MVDKRGLIILWSLDRIQKNNPELFGANIIIHLQCLASLRGFLFQLSNAANKAAIM